MERKVVRLNEQGHVAQLVRALRSHRRGHWFEPSRDHHIKRSRGVVGLTC